MASINDVLTGPECLVDIYEQSDENKWVECQIRKSRIGLFIAIPVIIVIVLILVFVGGTGTKIGAVVVGCALIGILIAAHMFWTPLSARNQHKAFQIEVKSRMDAGMSRADALREIQKERLKREEIASNRAAAQQAAQTQAAGMFAIANAMSRKQ